MKDQSRPPVQGPISDWEEMARRAVAQVAGRINLPAPCTYRLVVLCGPQSVERIKAVFTGAFGYGHWTARPSHQAKGKYELQALRTVELCTLVELLKHYQDVAELMAHEDCGTHRITIEPVK